MTDTREPPCCYVTDRLDHCCPCSTESPRGDPCCALGDKTWMDPRRTQYADMSDAEMYAMYEKLQMRAEIERHQAQRKTEQLARMALEPRSDFRVEHNELMAAMTRLLTQLAAGPHPPVAATVENGRAPAATGITSPLPAPARSPGVDVARPTPPPSGSVPLTDEQKARVLG